MKRKLDIMSFIYFFFLKMILNFKLFSFFRRLGDLSDVKKRRLDSLFILKFFFSVGFLFIRLSGLFGRFNG